jgi:hypothetical protein
MKLVSSNAPNFVEQTVREASESYRNKDDAAAALNILTKLKGIGPATASLLLAVMDPERVIFFADEAFYWLCCDGKTASIKYNAKEYRELSERSHKICKRLNVKAVDVEKVAFVIMRQGEGDGLADKAAKKEEISPPPRSSNKKPEKPAGKGFKAESSQAVRTTAKDEGNKHVSGKRKAAAESDETQTTKPTAERRSKRIQKTKEA